MTHIRGKVRATNDPAVLALRLPADLIVGDWYDVLAAVRNWLAEQGSDPDLGSEVLEIAGFDAVASIREWLQQP
ncbi:hypothetical protein B1R94_22195 [Mycolicibacterium litorale]|nr:hypothetical protein B1R94_22195 [Mycolicibacterium litorale]